MEKWKDCVYRARLAYAERDKYCYLYGAKGQVFTEELFNTMLSLYPEHFKMFTNAELDEIKVNSMGKIAFDCSGFVNWLCTGEKRYSLDSYAHATDVYDGSEGKTLANLPHGGCLILGTKNANIRHIGIDIGRGIYADMGIESTNWCLVHGMDSVRIFKYGSNGSTNWEYGFLNANVDYTGADLW